MRRKQVPEYRRHPVATLLALREVKRANGKRKRLATRHVSSSSRRLVITSLEHTGLLKRDARLGLVVTGQGERLLRDLERVLPIDSSVGVHVTRRA